MASSKVFMCGPEHSIAQQQNMLTSPHGSIMPNKLSLGPHWLQDSRAHQRALGQLHSCHGTSWGLCVLRS